VHLHCSIGCRFFIFQDCVAKTSESKSAGRKMTTQKDSKLSHGDWKMMNKDFGEPDEGLLDWDAASAWSSNSSFSDSEASSGSEDSTTKLRKTLGLLAKKKKT